MASTDSKFIIASSVETWARGYLDRATLDSSAHGVLSELVAKLVEERERISEVFLTVVVRTQLRRWEQLQDALLCLAAQTDSDFEVLLMLHDVEEEGVERVQTLLRNYPISFSSRVQVHEVHGGGRVRPLNASLDRAKGAYISFFDDDDLLMANWVEAFRSGAEHAPGQLVRLNVAVQPNRMERWTDGSTGQRSTGTASAEYASRFNLVDNIERNHTPFMGFAFPRSFFTFWGERFDEDLPVCEDWDAALRAATLVGAHSGEQLTAIYRQWEDAKTSYTSHAKDEWLEAERLVQEKLNKRPFFAPASMVDDVLEITKRFRSNEKTLRDQYEDLINSSSWRMLAPIRSLVRATRKLRHRD